MAGGYDYSVYERVASTEIFISGGWIFAESLPFHASGSNAVSISNSVILTGNRFTKLFIF